VEDKEGGSLPGKETPAVIGETRCLESMPVEREIRLGMGGGSRGKKGGGMIEGPGFGLYAKERPSA